MAVGTDQNQDLDLDPGLYASGGVSESEPLPLSGMTVVARDSAQLKAAHLTLSEWCVARLERLRNELEELEERKTIAIKAKYSTKPIVREIARAKAHLTYYGKVKAAIGQGYALIPNIDCELFAVRTSKTAPPAETVSSSWSPPGAPNAQAETLLEQGEGRNVSTDVDVVRYSLTEKAKDGTVKQVRYARASGFNEDLDFPFALADVRVLTATQEALALKLFDEVGVVRNAPSVASRRRGDPMVVGRVRTGTWRQGSKQRMATFLICWFVEASEL